MEFISTVDFTRYEYVVINSLQEQMKLNQAGAVVSNDINFKIASNEAGAVAIESGILYGEICIPGHYELYPGYGLNNNIVHVRHALKNKRFSFRSLIAQTVAPELKFNIDDLRWNQASNDISLPIVLEAHAGLNFLLSNYKDMPLLRFYEVNPNRLVDGIKLRNFLEKNKNSGWFGFNTGTNLVAANIIKDYYDYPYNGVGPIDIGLFQKPGMKSVGGRTMIEEVTKRKIVPPGVIAERLKTNPGAYIYCNNGEVDLEGRFFAEIRQKVISVPFDRYDDFIINPVNYIESGGTISTEEFTHKFSRAGDPTSKWPIALEIYKNGGSADVVHIPVAVIYDLYE